jgi:hypothetical protein
MKKTEKNKEKLIRFMTENGRTPDPIGERELHRLLYRYTLPSNPYFDRSILELSLEVDTCFKSGIELFYKPTINKILSISNEKLKRK